MKSLQAKSDPHPAGAIISNLLIPSSQVSPRAKSYLACISWLLLLLPPPGLGSSLCLWRLFISWYLHYTLQEEGGSNMSWPGSSICWEEERRQPPPFTYAQFMLRSRSRKQKHARKRGEAERALSRAVAISEKGRKIWFHKGKFTVGGKGERTCLLTNILNFAFLKKLNKQGCLTIHSTVPCTPMFYRRDSCCQRGFRVTAAERESGESFTYHNCVQ